MRTEEALLCGAIAHGHARRSVAAFICRTAPAFIAGALVFVWPALIGAVTITDLGALGSEYGGATSYATGINSRGQVVGYSYNALIAAYHAFLYSDGVMTDLGSLDHPGSYANGVNDQGEVAGYLSSFGSTSAFIYSGGVMTDLGASAPNSYANSINNAGEIAASSSGVAASYLGGVWTTVGTLGGMAAVAIGINDSGEVVGGSTTAGNLQHAFLYRAGTTHDLGTFGGPGSSLAVAINASGQITGYSYTLDNQGYIIASVAFLYSGGAMAGIGSLGAQNQPHGMNDFGDVVGHVVAANQITTFAFLYHAGVMTDLNSLLPSNSGWKLWVAAGINNAGQITGYGVNPSGQIHAFLLDTQTRRAVPIPPCFSCSSPVRHPPKSGEPSLPNLLPRDAPQ